MQANYMQVLPGGICFAHGPYTDTQCPHWPNCITDPQNPEYVKLGMSKKHEGPLEHMFADRFNDEWTPEIENLMLEKVAINRLVRRLSDSLREYMKLASDLEATQFGIYGNAKDALEEADACTKESTIDGFQKC